MVKLASWNVNSLKIRLEQVMSWMVNHKIDILGLQETKLIDAHFPIERFKEEGYHVAFYGQKSYNGVALVSRFPIENITSDVIDEQKRILAATVHHIRVINLYIPNGSHVGSEKYQYKLSWLEQICNSLKTNYWNLNM